MIDKVHHQIDSIPGTLACIKPFSKNAKCSPDVYKFRKKLE